MCPLYDIAINLVADTLFVVLAYVIIWALRRRDLRRARRFFGLRKGSKIEVFISGIEHPEIATEHVVIALEYEAAVDLRQALSAVSGEDVGSRFLSAVASLIGQDPGFLKVEVRPSPLQEVDQPVASDCLVLVGGPLLNTITAFYTRGETLFRYDSGRFLARRNGQYQVVSDLWRVAILEKMVLDTQTVFVAYGSGERETKAAVQYLARGWRELEKRYQDRPFGVRLSVDEQGATKVVEVLLP